MLGLAYLFLSVVTLVLYIAWLALLVWVFRRMPKAPLLRAPIILVGAFLALVPMSGALVRPLVELACDQRGRVVQLSSEPVGTGAVVVSGLHYNSSSVMDLLATRQIESIHVLPRAEFGDARQIATTADIHDGRAFSLRASTPDDPACAPYYQMLVQSGPQPVGYAGACAAFGNEPAPEEYLKVSEMHRRERSWRTAFYAIDWKGVRLERVSQGETRPVLEVREFSHSGTAFPLLLGLTPIGSFACRADKTALSAVASVIPANLVHHERATFSKAQLAERLKSLEERFWGFRFPDEVYNYNIWVYDGAFHARGGKAMDIQVDVQRHDLLVILYLSSNAKPNWTVLGGSSDQMILVNANLGDPHKVEGVPRAQVWNYDEDPASTSALKKYFLSRVVTVISRSISAGRHCKLEHRAIGTTTSITVQGCPMVVK